MRKILAIACLLPLAASAQLKLTLDSIQQSGSVMALQWTLSGLTEQFYSCQVATNGTTFYESNKTQGASWNLNMPINVTWAFRLQSISNNSVLPPADIDIAVAPSPTNNIYGDNPPDQVSISASDINTVTIRWRNNSAFETGFLLLRSAGDPTFSNTVYFAMPPTPQSPPQTYTNFTQVDTFAANTTYYFEVEATNVNGATVPSPIVSIAPNQSPPPASLMTSRTTDTANQIVNTWWSGGGSIQNWILQESIGNATSWQTVSVQADVPGGSMSFTTNGLTPGTVYYWKVFPTNSAGAGLAITNRVDMPIPATATSNLWYVDSRALTNGSNLSGTNWANAWPNLSSARWAGLSLNGDMIQIWPGDYNEYDTIMTPGMGLNVSLHAATNASAVGKAKFLGWNLYRANTTVNGAKDDNFVLAPGYYPVSKWAITNNQGFYFASTNTSIQRAVYMPGAPLNVVVKWCEVASAGIWKVGLGEQDQGGIAFQDVPSTGAEIAYNYVHDVEGTAIVIQGQDTGWHTASVHDNIISGAHCNDITCGPGIDVYGNYTLRGYRWQKVAHPDGWQGVWGHNQIVNNFLGDSYLGRLLYFEGAVTNHANLIVAGNICTFDWVQTAEAADFTTEPTTYNPGEGPFPWPLMTMSNVAFLNDTFWGMPVTVNCRKTDVTSLQLHGWSFFNCVWAGFSTSAIPVDLGVPNDTANYNTVSFPPSEVQFDWNNVENGIVRYSSNVTTVAGLPYSNNTAVTAGTVNLTDLHFTNSMAATNLSAWVSLCPWLATDMEGVTRTWQQKGALETVGTSAMTNDPALIAAYDNIDASGGMVHDDSGNHATIMMFDPFHWPTNDFLNGMPALSFHSRVSLDPTYFSEGQYGAVVYTNQLDGMPAATILFWGTAYATTDNSLNNMFWLSAGGEMDNGVVGSWVIGRNTSFNTLFCCRTNNSAGKMVMFGFPDTTANGSTGTNFYAVTFDGSQFIGYFNGSPVATNSSFGVTALRVGGSGQGAYLGVGCGPHNGTPEWNGKGGDFSQTAFDDHHIVDDGYPNAWWLHGKIAHIHIYNRALSATEIASAYSGGGGSSNPSSAQSVTAGTVILR